jgi:hypothetical protein
MPTNIMKQRPKGCGQGSGAEGSGRSSSKPAKQTGRVTRLGAEVRHAGCERDHARSTESLKPGKQDRACERRHCCDDRWRGGLVT